VTALFLFDALQKLSRGRKEAPIDDAGECRGTYEGAANALRPIRFILPEEVVSGSAACARSLGRSNQETGGAAELALSASTGLESEPRTTKPAQSPILTGKPVPATAGSGNPR
jgi:hypothetical protein